MAGKKIPKRRSPGEGGAYPYATKAGPRFYWKAVIRQPDGTERVKVRRGFETKTGALDDMRNILSSASKGEFTDPSKRPTGDWLDEWADGLRLADSTVASYKKNIRLHLKPYIGSVPLSALTPAKLAGLYKTLETSGRKDYREGEGLSARTTRYIHTILGAALSAAVAAGLINRNPAADPKQSKPPTSKQARPPEMRPWSEEQLTAFLRWARDNSPVYTAWALLESTGMRRGELLALRWRDVDLDAATIAVRRSAGIVRNKGEGATVAEGPTKTARPRVVDIASGDVALLKAWKRERGFARPGAGP